MKAFVILALASTGFAAVVSAADDARSTYERERAACLSGRSGQDQATCLREASAAYAEARGGRRNDEPVPQDRYSQNALLRCQPLPAADRAECERRITGGATSGSVTGGGVLRELRTVEPASSSGVPRDAETRPTEPMPLPPAAASAPR
ncbi:hypothetical protein [Azohydromonas aeria]|uniref:hypothetical protein n=1 Tax=Azohydromonas aeria TaxID=2590212 RepID=UPI0012F7E42B|nr:hypothetical protein [Azohydromonas aeria]